MSIATFDYDKPQKSGNKIFVFANQKGGVGKTTNCVMFADFLADLGHRFVLFDADPQQSIVKKRKQEREEHPDIEIPYRVVSYLELDSLESTMALISKMRNEDFDFFIDMPGSLHHRGSLALFANCDAIIVPFSYENTCVNSTNPFLSVVAKTCKQANKDVPPLFFLPNQINRRWGNKKELEARERLNERYGSMGTVLPMIPAGVEMQRYSSLYITPRQLEIVRPCYTALQGRTLWGIQEGCPMTAQVPPSVDYGNINDLLRQANGESEDTFVWKDQRRQSGNESGIAETGKSDNLPVEVKEKPRGKKKEAVDKNAGQARHAGKAKESPNTVPGINDKAVPLSSSPATSGQHLSQKTADEKKYVSTDHANISHDEIMEAVSAFGKQKEAAHRHMIFMPDKLYHDLVAGYGQRNLSAILCTLARLHVEKYKLAMRQMIASRTDFLE